WKPGTISTTTATSIFSAPWKLGLDHEWRTSGARRAGAESAGIAGHVSDDVGEGHCSMASRKQTNADAKPDWSLSEQQQTAVDLIVSGRNFQETADAIGVQRPTVSKWVHHDPGFQAALN